MRMPARWIITATLIGASVAGVVWLIQPRPVDVETATVRRGPIADTVADQGVARVRDAYVVAAPVNGRLERLPLEIGDPVIANRTVVARIRPIAPEFLDPRTRMQAESAVLAARAALEAATAQRDRLVADATRAHDQLQRTSQLAKSGVAAPQELETAQADAEQAAHAVRAADADIRTRQANLESAESVLKTPAAGSQQVVTVTSPASGVVTRLLQQSERTVTVGAQLVEVGDTSGLEAAIEFLSQDAVKIRPGQKAAIYNWGGPAEIPAQVRRVEPQGFTKISALGVEEQRTLVLLQFVGAPEGWTGLAPGYRVWGRVYLREAADAVLAPIGALVRDRGDWAVFCVDRNRAHLQPVGVRAMTDRDVEVISGVGVGDVVVVYPSDEVHEAVRVRER
ncbi:MAG TPA: HlyD family efflux transporter periplasmic adaptor subunit [Vicinamibacterales bacterium]|nr:HlyD family efflux transporter periplasmic adaptor subunit [Vicinamibacterales bacterium]